MRERPILFSAPMVRAIFEGRKTQTRRVVKPQPMMKGRWTEWCHKGVLITEQNSAWHPFAEGFPRALAQKGLGYLCPYGQPGDRLWVREAWRSIEALDHLSGSGMAEACLAAGNQRPWAPVEYIADAARVNWEHTGTPPHDGLPKPGRYRHASFMPRWASRITLEVTSVRVERLQDMEGQTAFESDALAEGVHRIHHGDGAYYYSAFRDEPHPKNKCFPEDAFRELWESINGAGSWDANPWVWMVEFRRVEVPRG